MLLTQLKINPPIIAHRGASAYAPENTFAAFKKALDLGVRWIELDVMLAACNEVIVFHDDTLDRTTNGTGLVNQFSYTDLQKLDAGSWFNPQFIQEKIPTLKEVLIFIKQHDLSINIEIKAFPGSEKETVKQVMTIIREQDLENSSQVLISSFSLDTLQEIRCCSSRIAMGLLLDEFFPGWEKWPEELKCASLNINQALLTAESMKNLLVLNKPLLSYTVNHPARAQELFSMGLTAVFTDYPDKILNILPPS